MKKLIALVLFSNLAIADEIILESFIDSNNDRNLNVTYRHQYDDSKFFGIINNGLGLGFRHKNEKLGESLVEVGYDFFHSGFVGSINLFESFTAQREYINKGVWLTSTALSTDIKINENLVLVPSLRSGWYNDGNVMKGIKLSSVVVLNDNWIVRNDISWRGWDEQKKEYFSPNSESRYSIVPMFRWSGMQIGVGPLYINEYENSLGGRFEFRMRDPAVRIVVDATSEYSSAYVYLNWKF